MARRDEFLARWWSLLPGEDVDPGESGSAEAMTQRRVTQGQAFFRTGRVTGLRVGPGRLSASVQGARATPYHVEALVDTLEEERWATVVATVAMQVRFAAGLLAGRVSDELVEALDSQGVDVVGSAGDGVDARCPCGDAGRPCAHVVALWEAAAERFEEDPFALLHLRGRGRQRFMADLSAARRVHGDSRPERIPLDALDDRGWERSVTRLGDLAIPGSGHHDGVAAALRLLGDPPGWAGAQTASEALSPLVEAAADHAGRLLRGDPDGEQGD